MTVDEILAEYEDGSLSPTEAALIVAELRRLQAHSPKPAEGEGQEPLTDFLLRWDRHNPQSLRNRVNDPSPIYIEERAVFKRAQEGAEQAITLVDPQAAATIRSLSLRIQELEKGLREAQPILAALIEPGIGPSASQLYFRAKAAEVVLRRLLGATKEGE